MKRKLLLILEIFLMPIIPLLLIGIDLFKNTNFYNSIFGFLGVEKTVYYNFTTQYNEEVKATIHSITDKRDFDRLWPIIESNTSEELPKEKPTLIGRFAIKNGSYTDIPSGGGSRRLVLVPDSVPIVALYCPSDSQDISQCDKSIIVGNLSDLRRWIENDKEIKITALKFCIVIIATLCGILLNKKRRVTNQ